MPQQEGLLLKLKTLIIIEEKKKKAITLRSSVEMEAMKTTEPINNQGKETKQ